ncbi:MAG TPA: hypothetical protein VGK10_17295 [Prolixibacteraceae bacterium]|jgi:hypothetical protein
MYEFQVACDDLVEDNWCHVVDLYIELINETFIPLCVKSGIVPTTELFRASMIDNDLEEIQDVVENALRKIHDMGEDYSAISEFEMQIEVYKILIRFSKIAEKLKVFIWGVNSHFSNPDGSNGFPLGDIIYIVQGKATFETSAKSYFRSLISPLATPRPV